MFLQQWHQRLTHKFAGALRHKQTERSRKYRRRCLLERLEERLAPVVGAMTLPAIVQPGTGFDGVVNVVNELTGSSGVLLADGRHVLTAAHVLFTEIPGGAGMGTEFSSLPVVFDLPTGAVTLTVPQSGFHFLQQGWDGNPNTPGWNGNPAHGYDLAILTLPQVAPAAAERYDLYTGSNEVNQPFTVVGYGQTGIGQPYGPAWAGTKREGTNTFFRIAASAGLEAFDAVSASGTPAQNALAFEFDTSANDVSTAPGDSGGPSFLPSPTDPSKLLIAGVTSYSATNSSYGNGTVDVDTRVSSFTGWINQIMAADDAPYNLVLDMSGMTAVGTGTSGDTKNVLVPIAISKDGIADTITAELVGGNIQLSVDGKLFYTDTASQIKSVTIDGSFDEDTVTVASDLGIPVAVKGIHASYWYDPSGMLATAEAAAALNYVPPGGNGDGGNGPGLVQGSQELYQGVIYTYLDKNLNRLIVLDDAPSSPVSISPGQVTVGASAISYTGVENVAVTTTTPTTIVSLELGSDTLGSPLNTFDVQSTSAGGLTINAGSGGNIVNVGDAHTTLDGIGTLTVHGGGTSTTLNLDDEATQNATQPAFEVGKGAIETLQYRPQYVVSDGLVMRHDDETDTITQNGTTLSQTTTHYDDVINFDNVVGLTVTGGATGNVFNVVSTAASTPVTINAGNGNDTVNAGDPGGLLQNVNSLTVQGGTGTTLNLDDEANAPESVKDGILFNEFARQTNPTYQITDHSLTRTDEVIETDPHSNVQVSDTTYATIVNYSHIAVLAIMGGTSRDTFHVKSTAAGTLTSVDGGGGSDSSTVDLGNLLGPVTILDSGRSSDVDSLSVIGAAGDNDIVKTATQVTWGNPTTETVNYSGIENLSVVGGSGNNTIIDPGSQNTTIIGGPAANTVVIANTVGDGVVFQDGGGTNHVAVVMGNLLGLVTLDGTTGTTSVTVAAPSGMNVLTLTAAQLVGAGETIDFNLGGTFAGLTIDGSSGQNQVVVMGSVSAPLVLKDVAVVTTTTLTSSSSSVFLNQAVTITATVGDAVAGAGIPPGAVQFQVDGTNAARRSC